MTPAQHRTVIRNLAVACVNVLVVIVLLAGRIAGVW